VGALPRLVAGRTGKVSFTVQETLRKIKFFFTVKTTCVSVTVQETKSLQGGEGR
jgi:hypothetical protein